VKFVLSNWFFNRTPIMNSQRIAGQRHQTGNEAIARH
jgi:hypothetical protein